MCVCGLRHAIGIELDRVIVAEVHHEALDLAAIGRGAAHAVERARYALGGTWSGRAAHSDASAAFTAAREGRARRA